MEPALTTILGLLERGGPWALASVFAVLWWGERSERRENTALMLKMVPDMIGAVKDMNGAIDMLRVVMGGKVDS